MAVVYIAEQGASIHKKGDRLYIYRGHILIRWIHTKDIDHLILVGNITLTSQTITYLLKHKIDTVFLTYYGKYKGRLLGELGKNVVLRLNQFRYLENDDQKLKLAQLYVYAKVMNMIKHLKMRQKRLKNPKIGSVIISLTAIAEKLTSPIISHDVLLGYEGVASKYYFQVFPILITNPNFTFNGRTKHPPQDEVNALLSLGYTFLMNQVMTQTYIVGLDPYYGALHAIDYGRQSLVLDLMEEFRPIVDNFVITLINKNEMRKEHFNYNVYFDEESDDPKEINDLKFLPVSLKPEAMKIFVYAFSNLINSKFSVLQLDGEFSLLNIILMQARKLVKHFSGEIPYSGFLWL